MVKSIMFAFYPVSREFLQKILKKISEYKNIIK